MIQISKEQGYIMQYSKIYHIEQAQQPTNICFKNEADLQSEADPKNEADFKNEDNLKMKTTSKMKTTTKMKTKSMLKTKLSRLRPQPDYPAGTTTGILVPVRFVFSNSGSGLKNGNEHFHILVLFQKNQNQCTPISVQTGYNWYNQTSIKYSESSKLWS